MYIMLLKTISNKLLSRLPNKRYYCNVNKSDYNLIEQKIDIVNKKLDFVFYLSIISSVSGIFIKVFGN
jgi:hypothetical protein